MSFEFIKKLNRDDKCKLIDLLEGMPQTLNTFVKMNISKPDFYRSILNTNAILLHKNNSINKYIGNNINVVYVKNPEDAKLQSMYSSILCDIEHITAIPSYIASTLKMLLDAPSFDDDCIAKIETSIVSLIKEIEYVEMQFQVLHFINTRIMPYKLMVYDFYTYLVLCDSKDFFNYDFDTPEHNHLSNIHNLLISAIYKEKNSYVDYSNIASLIYGYFKEIGVSSVIEKYDLLNRFLIPLKRYINNEAIETIKEFILDKINSNISMGDNIHDLLNMEIKSTNDININLYPNSIAKEVDSTIIMFKDMDLIHNIDDMRLQLSILNKNTIAEYIDIPKDYDIFSLSENDICYLKDINNIKLGTVYNNSYGMRYIAYYNNEFYLLFKNNIVTTFIYGISLIKDSNGCRKIVKIKKTANYTYKYISTI